MSGMPYRLCNKTGISMIEVTLATLIIMIGVVGVLSVSPQGWKVAAKSDKLSRAAELLREELEKNELAVLNCCTALPVSNTRTVFAGGQSTQQTGDVQYTVQTTVSGAASPYTIRSTVTWTGNSTGITGSIIASIQQNYRYTASDLSNCACVHL